MNCISDITLHMFLILPYPSYNQVPNSVLQTIKNSPVSHLLHMWGPATDQKLSITTVIIIIIFVVIVVIMMLFFSTWCHWILLTKCQAILSYTFYRWVNWSSGLLSGLFKNTQQVNDKAGSWIWLSLMLNLSSFNQHQGLDKAWCWRSTPSLSIRGGAHGEIKDRKYPFARFSNFRLPKSH